jgi:hypothetical protein
MGFLRAGLGLILSSLSGDYRWISGQTVPNVTHLGLINQAIFDKKFINIGYNQRFE